MPRLTRWSHGTRSLAVIMSGLAVTVLLAAAGGTSLAASAGTHASASASATATANPANGTVRVDWTSPGTQVRIGTPARGSGYACVVQTKRDARLVAYQPTTLFRDANSYEFDWLFAPYSVRHARFVSRKPTFQVQLCETGNGHSWNHWHQWFDGGAMMLSYKEPLKLGQSWGTGVVKGAARATLSFALSKGAATISGTTQISNYGSHSGDTGHEPNLSTPGSWKKWDVNRVNAFYLSSHVFKWQGTGSPEGDVGHALYGFDTGGTVDFGYAVAVQLQLLCARVLGNCVPE